MEVLDLSFHTALAEQPGVDVVWATADEFTDVEGRFERWPVFGGIFGSEPEWRRGLRYVRAMSGLMQRALASRRERPTVIHQHYVLVPAIEYAAMRTARGAGIPWFITPHEAVPYGTRIDRPGARRWLYRGATGMFALSEHNAREIRSVLGAASVPVCITHHGHLNDHRGPEAMEQRDDARVKLGLPLGPPIVLFLGELRQVKGLDVLLKAFARMLPRVPTARLVIYASIHKTSKAPYEELIRELGLAPSIDARWRFVSPRELALAHRAVDLVALPYLQASQSGACMTAYAFSRPVVASAIGGLTEQVVQGVTGRLVPSGDVDALANTIASLLLDRDRLDTMGDAAHRWAAEVRGWTDIAVRTVCAYRAGLSAV
jgi:glycosyltransferase involved in cell wall biosynthesis